MGRIVLRLVPGEGALPLRLGAEREEIARTMGAMGHERSARQDNSDYYAANAIQVEFEEDGHASFIGVAPEPGLELHYEGVDVLRLPAREVFDLIRSNEPDERRDFVPDEHLFRHQIITLWDADAQYEADERFPVWGQVGIGSERYLEGIEDERP